MGEEVGMAREGEEEVNKGACEEVGMAVKGSGFIGWMVEKRRLSNSTPCPSA